MVERGAYAMTPGFAKFHREMVRRQLGCAFCEGEPEPGYIEMLDNGSNVPCPFCNDQPAALDRSEP